MDFPVGEKFKLNGLVNYQEGSIVSRTLIDKKTGTVTLFAFDRGQGLSEHTAPFDAMVIVLEGKAQITIEGKAHLLSGGEMIIMPANKPHAVRAEERFKMLLVMIRDKGPIHLKERDEISKCS
ncbi:MAG: cupin domain-containing protein [Synergistetes bacterium]|nr:MAG: Cupin 2, conserved barrel domain protein [bacterium 42_11]MBC7331173.1 cupin domain-containing protein [Synergistota bacterium]